MARYTVRTSYFHQEHNNVAPWFHGSMVQLPFSSLTWNIQHISIAPNLVHRMIESADHSRVEVAKLVLVVTNILLVAVWYLEGEILF